MTAFLDSPASLATPSIAAYSSASMLANRLAPMTGFPFVIGPAQCRAARSISRPLLDARNRPRPQGAGAVRGGPAGAPYGEAEAPAGVQARFAQGEFRRYSALCA